MAVDMVPPSKSKRDDSTYVVACTPLRDRLTARIRAATPSPLMKISTVVIGRWTIHRFGTAARVYLETKTKRRFFSKTHAFEFTDADKAVDFLIAEGVTAEDLDLDLDRAIVSKMKVPMAPVAPKPTPEELAALDKRIRLRIAAGTNKEYSGYEPKAEIGSWVVRQPTPGTYTAVYESGDPNKENAIHYRFASLDVLVEFLLAEGVTKSALDRNHDKPRGGFLCA